MKSTRSEMTIIEHLEELRRRIVVAVAALVLFSVAGYFFSPKILAAIHASLPGVDFLIFTSLSEAFFVTIKIALYVGLVLALPVVFWQIWSFVAPALEPREKLLVGTLLPFIYLLFVGGLAFAFFVALPWTVRFFMSYAGPGLKPFLSIDDYLSFLFSMGLAFGLVFQLPLVILALTKIGLVKVEFLRRNRKYAILVIFVAAAIITPGTDMVSQIIMALPLMVLYELSIILAVIFK
ncbi:MAG: twin-arginine translocase subunit TatC [Firmicutes bacterium]|nr:twin-arginine translocase subunit TatC [Bacillota bacterium]MCL5039839.1 twin-arginine translocase subunit TatC [Bacillota bacterium]